MQMGANSKKTMHSISLIKQSQKLALIAYDAGEFLRRGARVIWQCVKGDLSE